MFGVIKKGSAMTALYSFCRFAYQKLILRGYLGKTRFQAIMINGVNPARFYPTFSIIDIYWIKQRQPTK